MPYFFLTVLLFVGLVGGALGLWLARREAKFRELPRGDERLGAQTVDHHAGSTPVSSTPFEPSLPTPASFPTLAEMRAKQHALEAENRAKLEAREAKISCHNPHCKGYHKHPCHDLDCKKHQGRK